MVRSKLNKFKHAQEGGGGPCFVRAGGHGLEIPI